MRLLPLALAGLLLGAVPAAATDLGKIDRTIKKEPAYKNKPLYGLLVFGPEAQTRVWVVLDGNDLYVDANGDGDLTAPEERFPNQNQAARSFVVADPNGKDRYRVSGLGLHRFTKEEAKKGEWLLMATVEIVGKYTQYCGVILQASARTAQIAHFHGPLTMGLRDLDGVPTDKLFLKGKPGELSALIGTIDPAHGCWVVVRNNSPQDFPEHLHPVAEVEFPPAVPGGQPVRRKYELKSRC